MIQIAVVYFSGSGTTAAFAKSVIEGAEAGGAEVLDLPILADDITGGRWSNDEMAAQLDAADAIILGTPTYMGDVSAQLKAFMDAMAPRWFTQAWKDKLASGFTASSLAAGDKLNTFTSLTTFAMQMGMIWVGTGGHFSEGVNPNGFYHGAGATASAPDQLTDVDMETGRHLGKRVAFTANRLSAT